MFGPGNAIEDGMLIYYYSFCSLLVITLILAWRTLPRSMASSEPEIRWLTLTYLSAWYACVAGDWLQGPYVYVLYQAHGFEHHDIARLYVAGYTASMTFGTFVGSLGDRIGRKRCCQLYCIFFMASCFTAHFGSYSVLLLGRLLGGVATSLLFSGFEAWLVAEGSVRKQLSAEAISHIFAMMWWGSSVIGILAGIAGDALASAVPLTPVTTGASFFIGGYINPFDFAIGVVAIGLTIISLKWNENLVELKENQSSLQEGQESAGPMMYINKGVMCIAGRRELLILMAMASCFEGSMYAFVFSWTPALQNGHFTLPVGMIFATFMMAYMCGSATFELLRNFVSILRLMQITMLLGAASFATAAVAQVYGPSQAVFLGFVIFEYCVGLYFPTVSVLKCAVVPERLRSTIYNLFRVPTNAIIISVLLTKLSTVTVFVLCFTLLMFAGTSTLQLPSGISEKEPPSESTVIEAAVGKLPYGIDKAN